MQAAQLEDGRRAIPFEYPKNFAKSQIKDALKNIRLSHRLNLEQLRIEPEKRGRCLVVGAAPSMPRYLDRIREAAQSPHNAIFAVNETHDWLIERGVIPTSAVVFEVSKELLHLFRKPQPSIIYYIASMCHPKQFRALDGHKRIIWHPYSDVPEHLELMQRCGAYFFVGGGSTTLLRTLNIGLQLGYRNFEMYGADSSFSDNSHISDNHGDNGPPVDIVVEFRGKRTVFKTYAYLGRQADEFRDWCENHHHKFNLKVFGDGLLPFVHREMFPQQYEDK